MSGLADFRSIDLRFQRRHSDNGCPVRSERRREIAKKILLVAGLDVFEHIQGIYPVKNAGNRFFQHVMHETIESPVWSHTLVYVFDEDRIEIYSRQLFNFLAYDASGECISTPHLQYMLSAAQHLCDELVTGKREGQSLGVVVPSLARHQSEGFESLLVELVENRLILGFTALFVAHFYFPVLATKWAASFR